ncbi:bifunctional adenosylcobinamide kinase/adenosylcobinamide-phosphate guanylyltransferase [bacterium]|nr:bifunctional adenosylcobinamide kinase/adenosylcobinamide-phosphate guanylyltransferase [bacterium]MBU1613968.1 bifunctional adenosylcobinamide kinase/adenosylcobinamide-phosphate guanylyltransferase [bacterium]
MSLILILGGARSGKSRFAVKLASTLKGEKTYLATASALDPEMEERIKEHKRERPKQYKTVEEPLEIERVFKDSKPSKIVLLDCLTLWISNCLLSHKSEEQILARLNSFLSLAKENNACLIIVSNEVGQGIVPRNKLARRFRDIAGLANQLAAKEANEVYWMVAGIPTKIKGKALTDG